MIYLNLFANVSIYIEYGDESHLFKYLLDLKQIMAWFLYLLECRDGSYYAGISNRLPERIAAHNNGLGARYTRGRGPVKLLASKAYLDRSSASKAEAFIKQLPRHKKLAFFD
jgi:putative endonuclease